MRFGLRILPPRLCATSWGKTYTTTHPIELLVYSDGRLINPDDVIIPTITPILESRDGPFRRAWFMGEKTTCLLWEAS